MACSAQLQQRVDRHDQQQRRGIEPWRRTWELDCTHGVTKNGRYRVAEGIHDTGDNSDKIEERADPTRIPKRKSRQRGEEYDAESESGQPFSEFECRHGPEAEPGPKRHNRGVVHRKKIGQRFVGDMQGKRYPQHHPRNAESESLRFLSRRRG